MATNYLNTSSAGAAGDVSYEVQDESLAEGLGRLRGALVVARLVTNYSEEAKAQGSRMSERVRVPIRGAAAVQDKTPGTSITPVQFTDTKADLALDQHKVWDVVIEDYGLLFSGPKKAIGHMKDAAGQLGEAVESSLLALYATAGRTFGSAEAGASATLIKQVRKQSVKDKWGNVLPKHIVWGPEAVEDLLGVDLFVKANESGSDEALVNASLGRKFGINHYEHEGVASVAGSPTAEHALGFQPEGIGLAFMDMSIGDMPAEFQSATVQRAMSYNDDAGNPLYQMRMIVGYDQDEMGFRFQVDTIYGVVVVRSTLVYDIIV